MTSGLQALLQGNERVATSDYKPPKLLREALPLLPGAFIITCMDPRVVPEHFCDFGTGKFACVRNAGGRVAQAEREIAFASAATNLEDVLIIHHDDCGVQNLHNDVIRAKLAAKGLGDPNANIDFGEIIDMDQSVRDDVETLRKSAYLHPSVNVRGYVLELMTTGKLREVVTSWGEGREHV